MDKQKVSKKIEIHKIDRTRLYDTKVFADRLDDLRKPNGKTCTYRELSKRIKEKTDVYISWSQLRKYHHGDFDEMISINNLLAIADFYGVSIDYLIGRSKSKVVDIEDRYISEKLALSSNSMETLTLISKKEDVFRNVEVEVNLLNFLLSKPSFLRNLTELSFEYSDKLYYNGRRVVDYKNVEKIEALHMARLSLHKWVEDFADEFYREFNSKQKKPKPLFEIKDIKIQKKGKK